MFQSAISKDHIILKWRPLIQLPHKTDLYIVILRPHTADLHIVISLRHTADLHSLIPLPIHVYNITTHDLVNIDSPP